MTISAMLYQEWKLVNPGKIEKSYGNSNLALQHSQIYSTQDYSCTSLDNLLSSCTCVKASSLSLKDDDVVLLRKRSQLYSLIFLNGHVYKTDTSVKRTLRVGPYLSLLPLFDSL